MPEFFLVSERRSTWCSLQIEKAGRQIHAQHARRVIWSDYASCPFGLSATRQQYFSLRTNQPSAISQQYFSLG
jgi:hypothetical protein